MDEQPKRNTENKNSSTVWFALIVVAALAVSLFLILSQNQKTLRYSDFERLLTATKYKDKSSNDLAAGTEQKARLEIS